MAQQDNINVNGLSLPVWAMQSTAQQIDDATQRIVSTPGSGAITAGDVGALQQKNAVNFNYTTLIPQFGTTKWRKIGEVQTTGPFLLECIIYTSKQSNPYRPDINVFGLGGNIAISNLGGSLVSLISGVGVQARIVLCSDGSIWGTPNGGYGECYASAIYCDGVTLFDETGELVDDISGDIVWDSTDNSYIVSTQKI